MKCFWRGLFVSLVYLAYAGTARCEEFAQAGPAALAGDAAWQTEQPRRLAAAAEPFRGEFQLVSGETEVSADAPVQSPLDAPIQVGKVDLNACEECCSPVWAHRSGIFGELLILRARNAEVAYAVAIDGAIVPPPVPPIQVGPVAVADPDFSAGFRVGGVYAMDDCSSVSLTYSGFQSSGTSAVSTTAPLVLRSTVLHPGTANAGSDFLDATGFNNIRFDLVDADYRAVLASDDLWVVNYLVGARYAGLNQQFVGVYSGTGTTDTLASNMDFDGGGFRVGLDGERHACNSGFMVYGKTSASFVAGEFRGRYVQGSDVDPIIVDTSWKAGRIVSILDMELGAGWQSACGRWRLTSGYMVSGWFNAIPNNQWIQSVQTNNFVGLGSNINAITFDGFTTRLDFRW
ncbi:MAG: Lpg1974 family pore-forming outer membrane protein [Pirellulaceae bacterium]